MEKKITVGQAAIELQQQSPVTRDPIEQQREMLKGYEEQFYLCIENGKKLYLGSFYVEVSTKKEQLFNNVLRNYFIPRSSCPTPNYDQTVYYYNRNDESIEFLWVIPCREACYTLKEYALEVAPEERQLRDYVLQFADGTLYNLMKKRNNELYDTPLIFYKKE